MTDKRITQPLPVLPTAGSTDPRPPPRQEDTDPMTLPPVVVAGAAQRKNDTVPDLAPPPAAVAHAEAESFLQRFVRPPRPPAPEPEQGASSDGRGFVAHYANNARPAVRTRTADPPPGVHVLEQLAELARAPSSELLVAQRDLPITIPGRATMRRRLIWTLCALSVAVGLIASAFIALRSPPQAPAASMPSSTAASITIPSPSIAPTPSPPAASASVASAAPTSSAPPAPAATMAPQRPRGESPKPPRPATSGAAGFMSEEP